MEDTTMEDTTMEDTTMEDTTMQDTKLSRHIARRCERLLAAASKARPRTPSPSPLPSEPESPESPFESQESKDQLNQIPRYMLRRTLPDALASSLTTTAASSSVPAGPAVTLPAHTPREETANNREASAPSTQSQSTGRREACSKSSDTRATPRKASSFRWSSRLPPAPTSAGSPSIASAMMPWRSTRRERASSKVGSCLPILVLCSSGCSCRRKNL